MKVNFKVLGVFVCLALSSAAFADPSKTGQNDGDCDTVADAPSKPATGAAVAGAADPTAATAGAAKDTPVVPPADKPIK